MRMHALILFALLAALPPPGPSRGDDSAPLPPEVAFLDTPKGPASSPQSQPPPEPLKAPPTPQQSVTVQVVPAPQPQPAEAPRPQTFTLQVAPAPQPVEQPRQAQTITLQVVPSAPQASAVVPAVASLPTTSAQPAAIVAPGPIGKTVGWIGQRLSKHGMSRIYLPNPAVVQTSALVAYAPQPSAVAAYAPQPASFVMQQQAQQPVSYQPPQAVTYASPQPVQATPQGMPGPYHPLMNLFHRR